MRGFSTWTGVTMRETAEQSDDSERRKTTGNWGMRRCKRESLQVTAALLEALGVPQQVGLPADICVSRLLDVEAFLRGNPGGADINSSVDREDKSPQGWSN